MPQPLWEGRGRAHPISKTQLHLGGSGVGPAEPAQLTGLTLGQALVVLGSCTGKGLKVLWLPASLSLGWGRVNPLFPFIFSLLSPSPIKLMGKKFFLLLPSGRQLLSLERNPPNPWFGPGPGARDGRLTAPAPCRARGCARSQPLAPSAPSPGNRHWVLQPEAPGITFSCGTRAAGAYMGSAWGMQICQNQTAQLWMPLITRSRAWCNTGPAQVRCKGQAGSTWV